MDLETTARRTLDRLMIKEVIDSYDAVPRPRRFVTRGALGFSSREDRALLLRAGPPWSTERTDRP